MRIKGLTVGKPSLNAAGLLWGGMLVLLFLLSFSFAPALAQNQTAPVFVQQRYLQAAEQGSAKAQFSLGLLYERGLIAGVAPDKARQSAISWYEKAANQAYAPAQFRLALMLQADQDGQERVKELYQSAASQGLAEAQFNLSLLLDRSADLTDAATWMRAAADQGLARAMRRMGILHLEGRGVPQDVVEAWIWLVRAVGAGDNESVVLVSEIDGLLNDEQREEAKSRLAAEQN